MTTQFNPLRTLIVDDSKDECVLLCAELRDSDTLNVIGFVHDEILIELPDEGGYVSQAVAERPPAIMCEEMESVLVGGIRVGCESVLSKCWSKDAGSSVQGGRLFPCPSG